MKGSHASKALNLSLFALFLIAASASTFIAATILETFRATLDTPGIPIFYRLLFNQDRFALWISLVLLAFGVLLARRIDSHQVERVLSLIDRFIVPITFLCVAVWGLGALFIYQRHPLSMDEFCIVYQSRVFAAGRLDGQIPPELINRVVLPPFIIEFFGIDRPRGLIASAYWPGTSLLMTPFTLLHVSWLFNPCVSAFTILCLHRVIRRATQSPQTASWVTIFMLASPVISINAMSFYAMPAHMLANVLFFSLVFHAYKQEEKGKPRYKKLVFAAGVVGGFALVLHNPIPHFSFAFPWLLWVATKRRSWLLPMGVGYLVFAVPLGIGWFLHLKSLDAQMPALANSILARLPQIFVWPSPTLLIIRLLAVIKIIAWATPGLLVFAAMGWKRNASLFWARMLGFSFLTLFGAYLFISYPQGHGWGYRFIHPAWFVLPVCAALFVARSAAEEEAQAVEKYRKTSDAPRLHRLALVTAALSLFVLQPFDAWNVHAFIFHHLHRVPFASSGKRSILFINPNYGYYSADLVQNDPFLRNPDWKLLAKNEAADLTLAQRYLKSPRVVSKGKWGEFIVEDEAQVE